MPLSVVDFTWRNMHAFVSGICYLEVHARLCQCRFYLEVHACFCPAVVDFSWRCIPATVSGRFYLEVHINMSVVNLTGSPI